MICIPTRSTHERSRASLSLSTSSRITLQNAFCQASGRVSRSGQPVKAVTRRRRLKSISQTQEACTTPRNSFCQVCSLRSFEDPSSWFQIRQVSVPRFLTSARWFESCEIKDYPDCMFRGCVVWFVEDCARSLWKSVWWKGYCNSKDSNFLWEYFFRALRMTDVSLWFVVIVYKLNLLYNICCIIRKSLYFLIDPSKY